MYPSDMGTMDYLNELERLYHENQRHEMTFPSVVLAYRVLKSSDLPNKMQQLARATISELTNDNMKNQLKAIHDNSSTGSNENFEFK